MTFADDRQQWEELAHRALDQILDPNPPDDLANRDRPTAIECAWDAVKANA